MRLFGPADVLGIDPRQVVRTEPPAGTHRLRVERPRRRRARQPRPAVAVHPGRRRRPGTAAPLAGAGGACASRPGCGCARPRDEPLPVLEIGPPARAVGRTARPGRFVGLGPRPGRHAPAGDGRASCAPCWPHGPSCRSRACSVPRLLAPFTDYIACVVPAFEAGRRAGLGQPADRGRAPDAGLGQRHLSPAGERLPAGVLPLGVPHRGARGLRVDRRAARAARPLAGGRAAGDGHQRAGFRRAAATVTPDRAARRRAAAPGHAPRAPSRMPPADRGSRRCSSILNAANARAATRDAELDPGPADLRPLVRRAPRGGHARHAAPGWTTSISIRASASSPRSARASSRSSRKS